MEGQQDLDGMGVGEGEGEGQDGGGGGGEAPVPSLNKYLHPQPVHKTVPGPSISFARRHLCALLGPRPHLAPLLKVSEGRRPCPPYLAGKRRGTRGGMGWGWGGGGGAAWPLWVLRLSRLICHCLF